MTTTLPEEASSATPLVDVQALVVAVRRRRRLWGTLALLGLILGGAMAVLLPAPPTAATEVLVAHAQDQPNDPGTLIRTDVALLQTTEMAGKALAILKSTERPQDFLAQYQGIGLTNNVLQITVKGTSPADAEARAKALAEAFVADHVARLNADANANAAALVTQGNSLRTELAQVNKSISDGSSGTDPATLESLYSRRAALTSQIDDFDQRAQEARVGTPQLVSGTQVVDIPHLVKHSVPKTVATDAGIGFVLGLAVGIALAAIGSVVADRPVLRREIAANLGASVIAELRAAPHRSVRIWQRRRSRDARQRLTRTLVRTVLSSTEPVSLLELGCAQNTAEIAVDLAKALAQEEPLVVVDGLPGGRFPRRQEPGGPVVVRGEYLATVPPQSDRIGVGSVAPGTAWTDLQYLGTRTVLVVRAGSGSAAWLHTVARQLADLRIAVAGVVLIDPDPGDRTDGTLWDGAQNALRGVNEWQQPWPGANGKPGATGRPSGGPLKTRRPAWAVRVPDNDQETR
ncbi:Wzz/FepE/Etk N-terminal domain-containing protein [Streptacidiphilus sp. N1-10]|uniref:Wzz/FepE/Etk N-terminal domain-containing protein n=1 Tax=Streptacidiphilus jeojiensis TaxID=3229225 RepID=A0ABV6XWM1_9ACTN